MRRILARLTLVLGSGVLLGSALLTGPASAAPVTNAAVPAPHVQVVANAAGDYEQLEYYAANGDLLGFVKLTTNADRSSRLLEICDFQGVETVGQVNPADANGNATGTIIFYGDPVGGGCYERNLFYPIRKFLLQWYDGNGNLAYTSPWAPPPSL